MRVREQHKTKLSSNFSNGNVAAGDEITVNLSSMNGVGVDDGLSNGLNWNFSRIMGEKAFDMKQGCPSFDVIVSDVQSNMNDDCDMKSNSRPPTISMINTNSENCVQDNECGDSGIKDLFNPTPLPRLISSLPPRSSSIESTSSTNTSNSVICSGINHLQQQHHFHSQQQSPQRRDSASASVGIVSVDDQTLQPNFYRLISSSLLPSATRRLSTSSTDSGAASPIPPNPLDMEIDPTPINPYLNHRNNQERFQNKNIGEEVKRGINKEDDPRSVDELMATELNKLSFQERESINEEIHGIDVQNAVLKETPELLRKSFDAFEKELQNLRPRSVALDRCQRLFGETSYLNTEEVRIMFLRCDLFNCKKAAKRMSDYAGLMLEIFGDFALQRRPYLTDLTDLELRILEAGGYQVLPGRDRAGRRIIGNLAFDAPKEYGVLSRLRVSVYVVMSVLEDVETQRKGAVAISWWHNVSVDDFIIRKKVHERVNCVPMRLGAYHCCIPSEVKANRFGKKIKGGGSSGGGISSGMANVIKAMAVLSVGSDLRPHLRFHTGSVVECIYALQSFGIHSDQIPVNSSSGKLKTKLHSKWLELRRLKDDSLKHHGHKFDRIIECPNQTDVLFGRGRPIMRHPGNAVLRSVVQHKLDEYASAKSKKQTTDVTWDVVRTLKGKYGARFLKEENIENNGLGWIEVSNETARQKVRIAFRDLRTKIMKTNAAEIEGISKNDNVETNGTMTSIVKAKRKGESDRCTSTPSPDNSSMMTTFTTPLPRSESSQQVQIANSSTSVFLAMDGIDMKRQRRCF